MIDAEAKREPVIDAPPVRKPWRTPHVIRSSAKSTDNTRGPGNDGYGQS